ncbi:PIN domain-like protein [Ceraceosorus guamensis]|uniref:PIN domain-like protein n=1 Tax=Ceraceosorus guamensis TaxID=1522189 RepID=A0A316VUF4_9BASI|nr:PIN domain-like protein [Ceraceosorus guamensis]PWN40518.1 PIN domain-like protein [Ceraceosorus guamensis]
MGIKNIFRLIKDHAPHAVREVRGWEELAGSKLAFDGTLMLMRLHFSPSESDNRHMLGLSNLLRTLRSHRIQPVFVFDNPEPTARVPEKLREHQKRKLHRARLNLRLREENKRMERIAVIKQLVPEWADMDENSRLECARYLQQWSTPTRRSTWHVDAGADSNAAAASEELTSSNEPRILTELHDAELRSEVQALKSLAARLDGQPSSSDALSAINTSHQINDTGKDTEARSASISAIQASQGLTFAKRILRLQIDFLEAMCKETAMDDEGYLQDLAASKPLKESRRQRLLSLTEGQMHGAFQAGSTSLAYSVSKRLDASTISSEEAVHEALETHPEPEVEPAIAETHAWTDKITEIELADELASRGERTAHSIGATAPSSAEVAGGTKDTTPADEASFEVAQPEQGQLVSSPAKQERPLTTLLQEMTQAHDVITTGYKRATRPLPPNLSQTAAELCSLHGVPVIWTGSGVAGVQRPGEAEALCAEIVKQGFADAVVSEDSDTLLYDVPMLRGALGGPLQMVDAQAVRRAFFPPERLASTSSAHHIQEIGTQSHDADSTSDSPLVSVTGGAISLEGDMESSARFMELALLCGTDFNRTVPSISIKRGLQFIREYGRIERILQPAEGDKELLRSPIKEKGTQLLPEQGRKVKAPLPPAKFVPPDGLSIAEYKQELTSAKRVFKRRPTLHRDRKTLQAWSAAPRSQEWNSPDGEALAEFWKRTHVIDEDDERAYAMFDGHSHSDSEVARRRRPDTPGSFGKNMFDDSPKDSQHTASWNPERQ